MKRSNLRKGLGRSLGKSLIMFLIILGLNLQNTDLALASTAVVENTTNVEVEQKGHSWIYNLGEGLTEERISSDKKEFFNDVKKNLFRFNAYYKTLLKKVEEQELEILDDIKSLAKDENEEFLFDNRLSRDEFSEKDEEFLRFNRDDSTLRSQIHRLENSIRKVRKHYFESDKGVKVYHPNVTNYINNAQNAIRNRKNILNYSYKGYDNEMFFSRVSHDYDEGYTIDEEISRNGKNISFAYSLCLYDSIPIDDIYLKDVEVYMSPFSFTEANGYAYLSSGDEIEDYESIVIARYELDLPEDDGKYYHLIKDVRNTAIHELGHIIEGRSNIKGTKDNIFRSYKDLSFEEDNKKERDSWSLDISENFAEDFKMFISGKLENGHDFEARKKTVYLYNDKVEDMFANILLKESK